MPQTAQNPNRRRAILTFIDLDGACAAALLLLKYPGALVDFTTASTVATALENLARRNLREVHVCGLGVFCPLEDVLAALERLRAAGTKVLWYCGHSYLDEYRAELNRFAECRFTGRDESATDAVASFCPFEGGDRQQAGFIRQIGANVENEDDLPAAFRPLWPKMCNHRDLVYGSHWRYLNYRDRESYPHAIAVLAGHADMTDADRELIKTFRRVGGVILRGESAAMREIKRRIGNFGPQPAAVLITGETGTGKEVVARLIHEASPRREEPFFAVNCATLEGELLQDQLFGHRKGAYTGAMDDQPGVFEEADGGTLFLDEVAEMPPATQAKLLRILQEGVFQRLGERRDRRCDVRIIASTNRSMDEDVRRGRFRSDLFYRLAVLRIHVPPLRERPDDIPPLIRHILYRKTAAEGHASYNMPKPRQMDVLKRHSWPGNVRELENVLERHLALKETDFARLIDPVGAPLEATGEIVPLAEHERRYIQAVFERFNRNVTQTAAALGITRNTLKAKLADFSCGKV